MHVTAKDAIYTRARDCLKIQQTAIGFGPKNRIQYKPTNHAATFHFTTAQNLQKTCKAGIVVASHLAVEEVPTPLKLDEDLCRNPAEYRWAVPSFRAYLLLLFVGFQNTVL